MSGEFWPATIIPVWKSLMQGVIQARVVRRLDSAIHQINKFAIQQISVGKTYYTIYRIAIYPVDSGIHLTPPPPPPFEQPEPVL